MFKVKEIDPETLIDYIFACQRNENPEVKVITTNGLMVNPLPPRIPLDNDEEKEWVESGRKSPNAWRLEMDDDFSFLITKKKK